MTEIGLVVNARGAWPDAAEIAALGLTDSWVRSIVYSFDELDAALARTPKSVRVCALLNAETEGVGQKYERWIDTVEAFAKRFRGRVYAVECGNEHDIWYDQGDRRLTPKFSANLAASATVPLHAAGMQSILTSVAGAHWQEYLAGMRQALGIEVVDFANLHPYGQRANGFPAGWGFGELGDVISRARDISGLPVAVTEWGIKIADAGGETGQAEYVRRSTALIKAIPSYIVPFATYFCWSDGIGAPSEQGEQAFGLRRADSSTRPAWQAFQAAMGGPTLVPVPIPDPVPIPEPSHPEPLGKFELGFLDWATREPELIGEPAEPREFGFARGISTISTTKGELFWVAARRGNGSAADFGDQRLSEVFGFIRRADGARFRWYPGMSASERVTG